MSYVKSGGVDWVDALPNGEVRVKWQKEYDRQRMLAAGAIHEPRFLIWEKKSRTAAAAEGRAWLAAARAQNTPLANCRRAFVEANPRTYVAADGSAISNSLTGLTMKSGEGCPAAMARWAKTLALAVTRSKTQTGIEDTTKARAAYEQAVEQARAAGLTDEEIASCAIGGVSNTPTSLGYENAARCLAKRIANRPAGADEGPPDLSVSGALPFNKIFVAAAGVLLIGVLMTKMKKSA